MVNAHTHLDLTHMGRRTFDPAGGFVGWVDVVRRERESDALGIRESVLAGIALSRRGGVAAVGDIAGCPPTGPTMVAGRTMASAGLAGVSYLEFFGMGRGSARGLDRALACMDVPPESPHTNPLWSLGLQPHATNTVALDVFARALAHPRVPISTHLAETPEEHEFIARGTGPQRGLLERVGAWDDSILQSVAKGLSPIAHLATVLDTDQVRGREAPVALVHLNDCSDDDLRIVAGLRASGVDLHVVYCPRASAYFRAHEHFGPHRYADMQAAGIPVALGTDSIINLGPEVDREGISTFSEMRLLHARDGIAPRTLLKMATVNGAAAIGLDPAMFSFARPGPIAGLLAAALPTNSDPSDPIGEMLVSAQSPQFLLDGTFSCLTET